LAYPFSNLWILDVFQLIFMGSASSLDMCLGIIRYWLAPVTAVKPESVEVVTARFRTLLLRPDLRNLRHPARERRNLQVEANASHDFGPDISVRTPSLTIARGSVEVKLKVEKDIWTAKKKEVHCIWFNLSMVPPKLWPIVHTKLLIIVDLLKICLRTHKSVRFKDYIMLFPKRDITCLGRKVKDSQIIVSQQKIVFVTLVRLVRPNWDHGHIALDLNRCRIPVPLRRPPRSAHSIFNIR